MHLWGPLGAVGIGLMPWILLGEFLHRNKLTSGQRRSQQMAVMGALVMSGPLSDKPTAEIRLAEYNVKPQYHVSIETFKGDAAADTALKGHVEPIRWGECRSFDGNITGWRMRARKDVDKLKMPPCECS